MCFSSAVLPRSSKCMSSPLPATSNRGGGYLALNISKWVKDQRIKVKRTSDENWAHGVGQKFPWSLFSLSLFFLFVKIFLVKHLPQTPSEAMKHLPRGPGRGRLDWWAPTLTVHGAQGGGLDWWVSTLRVHGAQGGGLEWWAPTLRVHGALLDEPSAV